MKKRLRDLKFDQQGFKCALAATFCFGLTAHGYMFADNSVSHDSLREFHAEILGNDIKMGSGRVFTFLYRDLVGSDVTLPWLSGLLALLWIGLAVYLTTKIFRVKSKVSVCLIAGIFTTNIAVSATIATYIHDLDSYMFSLLCAVAAVYLWKELRAGWLLGAILLAGSIGIYQGYLFTAVTLVMLDCILRLYCQEKFVPVFRDGLKAVGMILLGGILYYACMKGILYITGRQIVTGNYNSMDLILYQSPATILKLVEDAYRDWFHRLWNMYSSYPMILTRGITFVSFGVTISGSIVALLKRKMGLAEAVLCLFLLLLLPLGMNLIYVLTIGRNHDLMTFSIWLVYLASVLTADYLAQELPAQPGKLIRSGCVVLTALLLLGNVRFSNGLYMKKDLEYDAYLSLMTRVVGRMEAVEGYVPGETPVVFAGVSENINAVTPGFKDYWDITGMLSPNPIHVEEISRYRAYFDYIMGLPIRLADEEVWEMITDSKVVEKMPCYPKAGCIEFVDGILVVKMGQRYEGETISYYEYTE